MILILINIKFNIMTFISPNIIIQNLFKISIYQTIELILLLIVSFLLLDEPLIIDESMNLKGSLDSLKGSLNIYIHGYKYRDKYVNFDYNYNIPFLLFCLAGVVIACLIIISLLSLKHSNKNIIKLVSIFEYGTMVLILLSFIIFKSECVSFVYKSLSKTEENYIASNLWIISGALIMISFITSLIITFLMYVIDDFREDNQGREEENNYNLMINV